MKACRILLFAIFIICSVSLSAANAAADTPKEAVKFTVDLVLELLRDKDLSQPGKKQERRSKITAAIRDRFDFEEMAKRTLARHWKERTPEEQKEFVSIFTDLLINSYIGKIEAYTDEKITYDKEVIKGKGRYAVVGTTILSKDVDIPIEYKVLLRTDRWLVYDVVIEGVSFISTYRSQYDNIIAKESYKELIRKMKEKLKEVNAL